MNTYRIYNQGKQKQNKNQTTTKTLCPQKQENKKQSLPKS